MARRQMATKPRWNPGGQQQPQWARVDAAERESLSGCPSLSISTPLRTRGESSSRRSPTSTTTSSKTLGIQHDQKQTSIYRGPRRRFLCWQGGSDRPDVRAGQACVVRVMQRGGKGEVRGCSEECRKREIRRYRQLFGPRQELRFLARFNDRAQDPESVATKYETGRHTRRLRVGW